MAVLDTGCWVRCLKHARCTDTNVHKGQSIGVWPHMYTGVQWLTEMSTPLDKIYIYFCLTLTCTVNCSLNALTVSFGSLRNIKGVFFIYGYFSYTNSDTI